MDKFFIIDEDHQMLRILDIGNGRTALMVSNKKNNLKFWQLNHIDFNKDSLNFCAEITKLGKAMVGADKDPAMKGKVKS